MKKILLALAIAISMMPPAQAATTTKTIAFTADVWADNWFAMYVNGKLVGQDSVPITTTKSFNKETIAFSAQYPLTIAFIAKDYVENATGLEYIGAPNQQIGDAGFIAQIKEKVSQKLVTATDSSWKTFVTFKAPLNPECVTSTNPITVCKSLTVSTPAKWSTSTFKDFTWSNATEYSEAEVGVKDGYLQVDWAKSAKLIWSSDLKLDNTLLIRKVVKSAASTQINQTNLTLTLSGSDGSTLPKAITCAGTSTTPTFTWTGLPANTESIAITMETIPGPPRPGDPVTTGNHFLYVGYNIKPTAKDSASATLGTNFQNRLGYTPPCSQGPGAKIYTVTLYALSSPVPITSTMDGNSLQAFASQHLIGKVSKAFTFANS